MKVETYKLKLDGIIEVQFLNYGGIIKSLRVPNRMGMMDDVVLGLDHAEEYLNPHPYFGAIIGRYGNRIHQGKFRLNGQNYQVSVNNGDHSLHGGVRGFDKVFWEVSPGSLNSYTLQYTSPDGEEGFPGELKVKVTYSVTSLRELVIDYEATTSKATPLNLTNHTYFNLTGDPHKNILGHELWIDADRYTEVDQHLIPTGELLKVTGPMDFLKPKLIGLDIDKTSSGYDHNYVLNQVTGNRARARVYEPRSGRVMEVFTTEPGIQFYSGNFLDGSLHGKKNVPYQKHYGFCLETQHFPDSPNQPHFPSTILSPGERFSSRTIYRFLTH